MQQNEIGLSGFYTLPKTDKDLKRFFKDAIMLAYNVHIDILPETSWSRERTTDKNIKEMIDGCSIRHHNVCVDRSIQHDIEKYGEIGYTIIGGKPSYFLYIFVTLNNLSKLVNKYNLKMR